MGQPIGYQHGITAMMNRLRDMDPDGTVLVKVPDPEKPGRMMWPSIDTITKPLDQWKSYDKAERAFTILCYDHDAYVTQTPDPAPTPPPDEGPPVAPTGLAPQTYNRGSSGQDARYCTRDSGNPDGGGFHYDENGLCRGGRSGNPVPGLKPADMMDGKGACDPYEWGGVSYPPWPPGSYEV
jgi:hypothetical protein